MILRNDSFKVFFDTAFDKTVYCYGIGDFFERAIDNFSEFPWDKKLAGLIDADPNKQGKTKNIKGKEIEIISLEGFLKKKLQNVRILITTKSYYEIVEKLNQIEEFENIECYIYFFMCNLSLEEVEIKRDGPYLIPPIIHYCWFGRKELPDLYKRCIDSWHRFCPNYEIVEWNENNCDLNENLYSKQAYEVGKFGFVPDYYRLKIIYEQGGIYLDTDVELIKNLDILRHDEAFCGMQCPGQVAFGLGFGSTKGNKIIKKLMKTYDSLSFINEDGTFNEKASPVYQTRDLELMGMKKCNSKQYVDGLCIYPTWVLSPINIYVKSLEITKDTYAIHHFDGSWVSEERIKTKNEELLKAEKIKEMFKRE